MSTTRRLMSAMPHMVGEIAARHKCEGPREAGLLDCRYLAFFFVVAFFGFSAASFFFGAAFFDGFCFGASFSSSSASGLALAFFGAALAFLSGASSCTPVPSL